MDTLLLCHCYIFACFFGHVRVWLDDYFVFYTLHVSYYILLLLSCMLVYILYLYVFIFICFARLYVAWLPSLYLVHDLILFVGCICILLLQFTHLGWPLPCTHIFWCIWEISLYFSFQLHFPYLIGLCYLVGNNHFFVLYWLFDWASN